MTKNLFAKAIEQDFIRHALEEYPKEACGLIIDAGVYVPMKNVHETPKGDFRMNAPAFNEYYLAGRVKAVMHSHTMISPYKNNFPSRKDMISQAQMKVPWGIVHITPSKDIDGPFYFGDEVPIADLVGREFRPNVHDCYSLLRDDMFLTKGIRLPQFPREGLWWDDGKNILEQNFAKAGFIQIDKTQLRPGNVMLGNVNAPRHNKVLNHIMIVKDKGQILHHLNGRLSRPDPIQQWIKTATVFLKYTGEGMDA